MSRDYKRFIILSFGRSGSTLLSQALQSDPRIICFGELFNSSTARVEFGIEGYERGDADARLRAEDPARFLQQRVFQDHGDATLAVGFKFNYDHFWQFEGIIDILTADTGLRVVHLTRRNRLRTLVSLRIAERSGKWLEYAPEPSVRSRLRVSTLLKAVRDPARAAAAVRRKLQASALESAAPLPSAKGIALGADECRTFFERMAFSEERWQELFVRHEVLSLTYEDLATDLQNAAGRVQLFLGLDVSPVGASLKKQNPESLQELIENYDELRNAFLGTPEEAYFDN